MGIATSAQACLDMCFEAVNDGTVDDFVAIDWFGEYSYCYCQLECTCMEDGTGRTLITLDSKVDKLPGAC